MKELELIDNVRRATSLKVRNKRQKLDEQYFTPGFVTNFIARNLINQKRKFYNILDVASGVGNIGAAVSLVISQKGQSSGNQLHAVEIDEDLVKECNHLLSFILKNTSFDYFVYNYDFLSFFIELKKKESKFNTVIMNPPYKKLARKSYDALKLLEYNIEYSPNLYSLMMSCALDLLDDDGELIAIVPRSFCSGALFATFRKKISENFFISYIHLFKSRKKVFSFDGVQQETIIIKIMRKKFKKKSIVISYGDDFKSPIVVKRDYSTIIFPKDRQNVIHIPHSEVDETILNEILSYKSSLEDLGLKISTGKVVDFRNEEHLRFDKNKNALLFCKENLGRDFFIFSSGKIKNFIEINELTKNKILDRQCHIIMNRMFFKESPGVITAHIIDCTSNICDIAVENHLNYISGMKASPLDFDVALGLKCYLESKLVSDYFRRFLGSTQINAADIKSLPLPSKDFLIELGRKGDFGHDE